eukprot:gene30767-35806_t
MLHALSKCLSVLDSSSRRLPELASAALSTRLVMGVLTGGMALLARMRSQQKAAPVEAKPKRVYFVYGSQTGTAHEIARTFHAEATEKGIEGETGTAHEIARTFHAEATEKGIEGGGE